MHKKDIGWKGKYNPANKEEVKNTCHPVNRRTWDGWVREGKTRPEEWVNGLQIKVVKFCWQWEEMEKGHSFSGVKWIFF